MTRYFEWKRISRLVFQIQLECTLTALNTYCSSKHWFILWIYISCTLRPRLSPHHPLKSLISASMNRSAQFCSRLSLPACEKDVKKVCANSSEENLQPFRDKMEGFISAGESSSDLYYGNIKTFDLHFAVLFSLLRFMQINAPFIV